MIDLFDVVVARKLSGGGGGSAPVIEALSVTQNDTYTAPSGVDGYNPVTVSVSGGSSDFNKAQVSVTNNNDLTLYVRLSEIDSYDLTSFVFYEGEGGIITEWEYESDGEPVVLDYYIKNGSYFFIYSTDLYGAEWYTITGDAEFVTQVELEAGVFYDGVKVYGDCTIVLAGL